MEQVDPLEALLWLAIGVSVAGAALIYIDLTCDNIAGAFRDALHALRDALRP